VANLLKVLEDDGAWKQRAYDLTPFRGESLVLYFEVFNDSTVAGERTWMFLDDVSLQVCTGPTATNTPTVTDPVTPTATPQRQSLYLPLLMH